MEPSVDRTRLLEGRHGLHHLARLDSVWAEPRPRDEAVRRSLELSVAALGDRALLLRNTPARSLDILGALHRDPAALPALERFAAAPERWRPGLLAAVRNGRPAHFPPREADAADMEPGEPPACLSVPLRTPGGVLGSLLIGGPGPFTEDELFFAQQLADRIAAGLGREELLGRLAAERRWFGQVLDGLPEGILLRSPDGDLFANAAAKQLLGSAEPDGWPFEGQLWTPDGRAVPFEELPLCRAAIDGKPTLGAEYLFRRREGDEATLLLNASPTLGPRPPEGPGGAVAIFQDIGERKDRLQLERLLSDIGRTLLDYSGPDETEPLRRIAAAVAREREEWCAFSLIRADGSHERIALFHPDAGMRAAEERLLSLLGPRNPGLGELQELLRDGEPLVLGAGPADGRPAPPSVRAALAEFGPISAILAPLCSEGEYLGAFVLARIGGRPFGENEQNFAAGLVSRATLAIRNARLTRALERERDLLLASRDDARAANATLEAIVRHAPVGIAYVDQDLRFVLVNEVLARLAGKAPTEHVGRPVEELLGNLYPTAAADIRKVLEHGRPVVRRDVAPAGGDDSFHDLALYPVRDERNRVIGATLIDVDQTAQVGARRRIAELAALEHRRAAELTCMLDANPNAIALFGADGRLRYASARLGDLLTVSPDEMVNRHFAEVFGACRPVVQDPSGFVARTAELFADRTRTFTAELEFELPERRSYRTTTAPVLGHGAYLGRIFVFVDVTTDRELDRQRSEFLSVASHELKTPLTPLSLSLQGLERRLARGQPVDAAMVSKSRRQVTRLTALIDYLLDLSRLESGRLELGRDPVSLSELAEEVVDEFRDATQIHEIICAVPSDPVIVAGDRSRLEQVLVNLVQNAIKYSPRGGRVVVAVERHGGEARVSVADRGIGIPADERERVFERFFRAKNAATRNFGGLGIGLYVSNEIVSRHGGRFEVESVPGQGSTFRFSLPLGEANAGTGLAAAR